METPAPATFVVAAVEGTIARERCCERRRPAPGPRRLSPPAAPPLQPQSADRQCPVCAEHLIGEQRRGHLVLPWRERERQLGAGAGRDRRGLTYDGAVPGDGQLVRQPPVVVYDDREQPGLRPQALWNEAVLGECEPDSAIAAHHGGAVAGGHGGDAN